MEQFLAVAVEALVAAGIPTQRASKVARLAICEIETTIMSVERFQEILESLKGSIHQVIETVFGGPIDTLLIAPVPDYLMSALPTIVAAFPAVILADNFKAGNVLAGQECLTLDAALATPGLFDACLLGTVDQRVGRIFRNRIPQELLVSPSDLALRDPDVSSQQRASAFREFRDEVGRSPRPLVFLTSYVDTTFGPTLEALGRSGFDVFVVTRRPFSDKNRYVIASPSLAGVTAFYVADFNEMLTLLRESHGYPVLVNYARFLASNWDMRNTVSLFAYSIAVMRAIAGPGLLHLYDAYNICNQGLEVAPLAFALYRSLLESADGILVNADVAPILGKIVGPEKPVISFLRYGPHADPRPEPDPGPFSIAIITNFVGEEASDPTRDTPGAIRSLLRQGIHVQYFTSAAAVREFQEKLPPEEAAYFHVHAAIRDQRALVREISRYHAGWLVPDLSSLENISDHFPVGFARDLADSFVSTTIGTASMLSGCAGLPNILIAGNYVAKLYPPGAALEVHLDEVPRLADMIAVRDWPALRRAVFAARHDFEVDTHIHRLSIWLEQFYDASPNDAERTKV